MADNEPTALQILFPEADVAVFSRHRDTLDAARALENDWRFARVGVAAEDGDVLIAAAAYKDTHSPDLVIVQTDTIDASFTAKLEELAGHCDEGTAAIVIGPVNDVYLYRKLIDMGVSDYLVHPVSTAVLADVIGRALVERKGVKDSRLIVFTGAKGGVGTTALAQAAAWICAEIQEEKTALLDGSGGWSTLGVGIGYEAAATLAAAARAAANADEEGFRRMLYKASDRLSVLATGGDSLLAPPITGSQFEVILDMLMARYPVVVADLSQAPPDVLRAAVTRAGQMFVVATPLLSSLRAARSLAHEIRDMRGGHAESMGVVLNMQGLAPAQEISRKDAEQAMDFPVAGVIPFAPKIFAAAEGESRSIVAFKDGKALAEAHILPLLAVSRVTPAPVPSSGGILGALLGRKKGRG